jgi:hypothetical protein
VSSSAGAVAVSTTDILARCKPKNVPVSFYADEHFDSAEFFAVQCRVDPGVVNEFLSHRFTRRAKLSRTSSERIAKEARMGRVSVQDALELMMLRGWTGFNAGWVKGCLPDRADLYGPVELDKLVAPAVKKMLLSEEKPKKKFYAGNMAGRASEYDDKAAEHDLNNLLALINQEQSMDQQEQIEQKEDVVQQELVIETKKNGDDYVPDIPYIVHNDDGTTTVIGTPEEIEYWGMNNY